MIAGPLASITVTPSPVTLVVGAAQQFAAVGKDSAGNVVAFTPTWSVVAGGGSVDQAGRFTAGSAVGTFTNTVQASNAGIKGFATVTVTAGKLATITVTPDPATLAVHGRQQFVAVGTDVDGNSVPIAATWSVVAGGGTVDTSGLFTAGATPGTYSNTVMATSGALSGTATVVVTAGPLARIVVAPSPANLLVNGVQQFTAVGLDANGDTVSITPVWAVVAGGGAVDGGGLFTAGAITGTFANTVQATSGALSGTVTVNVTAGPLATMTVTPNPATMPVNGTQQFVAVGRDANGNTTPIAAAWAVVAGGGSISSTGLFTAGGVAGTFASTVRATSGALSTTATVVVTAGPLATITVAPNPSTMLVNGTQSFTAVGKDASGNTVPITPVWSVVAGGGAVDGTGLFVAGPTPGTFPNTVQAASGAITGAATVNVTAGPLASVVVTPSPASLIVNGTQQFVAVGRDINGNTVPIAATWSVVAGGGAITSAGMFTAGTTTGTFSNTVRATSGALSGTATVVVTAGALASITVTPNPALLSIGGKQQFAAVGKDASGNLVPITPTWSVVAGGGAIASGGLFTAGAVPGTFTNSVQATSGAVSGAATVVVSAGPLASVAVTPSPAALVVNGTQQFVAAGTDASGNAVPVAVTWSVVAGGGSISSGGLFTAGALPGAYPNTIKATSGALSATATVNITAGPLASITVTPNPASVAAGGAQQFVAVGRDVDGNAIPIAPAWSVVAGGGSIASTGLFTAGALAGTYTNTIKATLGALSGSATVVVTAGPLAAITVTPNPAALVVNGAQQFAAVGTDANGNVVPITPAWSVVAGGGAVSGAGLFTAGTVPGIFTNTVRATSGAISGAATVTVTAGPLASITVTPNPVTLPISGTQQFSAVGRDVNGNTVPIAAAWTVVAGGGSITGGGLFTAGGVPGTYTNTVTATSGALSGTATVTVTTGPLASVTVTPNPATLPINGTQSFTAVGKDAAGNVVAIAPTWSVVAGGGAITSGGLFTAGAVPGTYTNTVQATSGALSGTATVTVTTGPLASITVTPNPATLAVGATRSFTAVGKDAGGNVVPVAPVWSVVAGGGAVDGAGLFTAGAVPGTFTNTVQATSGAVSGAASVTLIAGPLASITVTPNPATLAASATRQFAAVGRDAYGNVVTVAPTWTIVAGGGTIGSAGLFTAGSVPGTFTNTVVATSAAVAGTATVVVTAGALASITVTPNPAALSVNGTQQFLAVGRDASGNAVPITPTWAVVAGGGAVDGAGLFTAGAVPGTFTNTVRATNGAVTGTATVVVAAGPLASITVTPNPVSLLVSGTQQFTAVGRDADGNAVPITPTWSVVAGGGAVNGTGLFTAGAVPGTFTNTVRATSGALSGAASVVVTAGPLASIVVTPNPGVLAINGTQPFTAAGRDVDGNAVPIAATWTVVAGGGSITSGGVFTAGAVPGTFTNTVQATSGAVSGAASVTVTVGPLASVTVTPNSTTLPANGTQQFTAVGKDAGGNVVPITPVWSVVAGGGAVDGAGLFTAGVAPGTFTNTVRATSGALSGAATVTVTAGSLASISIAPNPSTLLPGGTQQFAAVGRDINGNVVPILPTWSVVAGGGVINGTGLFTAALAAGTFTNTVQATSGALSATATVVVTTGSLASITVTPNPVSLVANGTQQFTAVGRDINGNLVPILPTWSVVAGGGAVNGSGLFTAGVVPGIFTNTVQAASGAVTGTATVTVTAGPLTSITVTPNPVTLVVNGTQQFTAVGRDANGNTVAITPTWSVVAGGGAMNGTGLFTAGAVPGTFTNTVQATSGAVSGTASVTVTAGSLASITVTPNPVSLVANGTQQFTAVGRDINGNTVAITPTWSVVAGGGAVNGSGLFTAGAVPGIFSNTVQAASGAVTGTATVTVTAGALATITVTPTPVTLPVTGMQQFTAVGRDVNGNTVAIAVAWTVAAGGGSITSGGLFTAGTVPGTYTNTVTATSGALSGTATVTVTTGPLATITVTPNPATLAVGGTQSFTAVGKDASGNVVAIAPTWSVVAGGGAITSGGSFTAGAVPGTYTNTVTATSGAVSGTATVTVTAGPLASITVTPNPAALAVGGTQSFTAVGKDAGGNVVPIAPIWSVVAGGGAIDGAGLFTAGAVSGTFTATVQATSGAVLGNATVVVTPGPLASITVTPTPATLAIGGTQQFTAVGHDAGGNVVTIAPAWTVAAGGGSIGSAGLFTAGVAAGTFTNTVRATSGAVSGTATVVVTAGSLASITVTPNPGTLPINGSQTFTAVGRDVNGNTVPIAATWTVVAGGGSITSGGLFTAGAAAGTFPNTVRATSGAVSGTATVVVMAGPLASIAVSPNPVSLAVSGTQQFTAVGTDAGGNVVPIAPTWSVVAGGGAVDGAGMFTAGAVTGTFPNTVRATSGALSGAATVTVTAGALASLTIAPNPASLSANGTQQFAAVGRDINGNVVAIAPSWSVVAGGGAITSGGLFTAGLAAGTFTNTVRATSGAVSAAATVVVSAGSLASITLTPNPVSLVATGTQQFAAVGRDVNGNTVPIVPTWSVVAGGGTVNGSGLFTAGTVAGAYPNTVTATSGAISGTATVTVTAGPLATITVTPNPTTLAANGTRQFTAVGRDANGNPVAITPAWSVAAGGGAITGAGLFTAGTVPGTYTNTVTATSGAISGTATVTVTAGLLASITVTPDPAALVVNGTQQFVAVGRDVDGNTIPISATWSVVAGGGSVDGAGLFTAGTVPGIFANTVRATSGAISGAATVTVTAGPLASITVTPNPVTLPINGTQQFTAVGRDANGNTVPIAVAWTIAAGGGAITSGGLFTAGGVPGTYTNTVTATSGALSGTATVTVTTGPLASITITPNPATLAVGGTQSFTAVGKDAGGNVVAIAPTWSVVAGGGAITSGGLFTAGAVPGAYTNTVTATSGAVSGAATVTVTTGPLASITVTPNPAALAVGATQSFTAVGKDAAGNVVPIAPVWSVVAGGGAVDGAGLFTAGTLPGTFTNTVQATSGAVSGAATVVVAAGPLASISVTPNPAMLAVGGTQQFTAVGRDADGNVVAIAPTWTVVAGGGSIGSAGLFTAGLASGTFTNTVTATSGAVAGTATVVVTAGALATITVTPNPATLAINGSQTFTAVGRDVNGNTVPTAATWTVVAGGGSITSGGLFTAGTAAGTFTNTVQATSGAVSGSATVTVTTGALATIIVMPNPATLAVHGTQQFTAVGKDAGGNVIAITPTWSVVAGGGAITGGGLFTAGLVDGTFTNTVQATSGAISGNATVVIAAPPPLVDLGAAATYGVLGGSAVGCTASGTVNADVGVWPGTAITGFPTCTLTGTKHAGDATAQTAQTALTAAYAQLAAMACGATPSADLSGQTLTPGVYCAAASQALTGTVILDAQGDPNASFVIKAGTTLITAGAQVTLVNGAQAKNVYWLVGSSATIGTGSAMRGDIIALTAITLNDGATILGRALALNAAVTLGTGNVITLP